MLLSLRCSWYTFDYIIFLSTSIVEFKKKSSGRLFVPVHLPVRLLAASRFIVRFILIGSPAASAAHILLPFKSKNLQWKWRERAHFTSSLLNMAKQMAIERQQQHTHTYRTALPLNTNCKTTFYVNLEGIASHWNPFRFRCLRIDLAPDCHSAILFFSSSLCSGVCVAVQWMNHNTNDDLYRKSIIRYASVFIRFGF